AVHDRNLLDVGDGVGVIDWQRFGQGAPEMEAGTFLGSVARLGVNEQLASQAARATETFLRLAGPPLDKRLLAWHLSVALLCRVDRLLTWRKIGWNERAQTLLGKANSCMEDLG